MFLIIMDQSSLFKSFVCHLDLLSYLMGLHVSSFALCGSFCSEQRGNSLSFFTRSYCTKTKVSGANCEALKIVSLLTQRPNMFHYVKQMQWAVHRCWLLSPGLFCLLVMKGEMGKSLESVQLICACQRWI